MVRNVFLGAVCSAVLLGSSVFAAPGAGASGPSGEVFVAGGRFKLSESVRRDGQKASDQQVCAEGEKKGSFSIGGRVGYNYELPSGIVLGVRVEVSWNGSKIDGDDGKGTSKVVLWSSTTKTSLPLTVDYQIKEARQRCIFGGDILLGTKVASNLVVGVTLGVRGTNSKISQVIWFEGDAVIQNNAGLGDKHAAIDGESRETGEAELTTNGTAELKITTVSLVPGIFVKYFFTRNVFVGLDGWFNIGLNRKVDSKYTNDQYPVTLTLPNGTIKKGTIDAISEYGSEVYAKQSGFGVGVCIGCVIA